MRSSHDVGQKEFVHSYFKQSRLHFIGTWRTRYKTLRAGAVKAPVQSSKRIVLHVDMDAFFASVSLRGRDDLKGKPVVICHGSGPNSEISCANYPARSFGIKAQHYFGSAKERCPELVSLPYEFEKYITVAESMYRELFALSDVVLGMSCDEAYLDITETISNSNCPVREVAESLRQRIYQVTGGCTASIGIGNCKMVAKIATGYAKPDGVGCIDVHSDLSPILELPLKQVPGIGWKTLQKIEAEYSSLVTCGDMISSLTKNQILSLLGQSKGTRIYDLCSGVVEEDDWVEKPQKEVSVQISWGVRMSNYEEVTEFINALCGELVDHIHSCNVDPGVLKIGMTIWKAKKEADPSKMKGYLGHGQCHELCTSTCVKSPLCKTSQFQKEAIRMYDSLASKNQMTPTDLRGVKLNCSKFVDPEKGIQGFFNNVVATTSLPMKSESTIKRQQDATNLPPLKRPSPDVVDICSSPENVINISSQEDGVSFNDRYEQFKHELDAAFPSYGSVSDLKTCDVLCSGDCGNYSCNVRCRLSAVAQYVWDASHSMKPPQNINFVEACKAYCEATWNNGYFTDACNQILTESIQHTG